MPINGKNKGNDYERKIAKRLTDWSGREFTRTPGSGGLHWKENNTVSGDIVPPSDLNDMFVMSVELKKQEVPWDFDFLMKGTSSIIGFYKQCKSDADDFNKFPLLIFSKNRRRDYVIVTQSWTKSKKVLNKINSIAFSSSEIGDVVIFDLEEFLACVTLKDFLK